MKKILYLYAFCSLALISPVVYGMHHGYYKNEKGQYYQKHGGVEFIDNNGESCFFCDCTLEQFYTQEQSYQQDVYYPLYQPSIAYYPPIMYHYYPPYEMQPYLHNQELEFGQFVSGIYGHKDTENLNDVRSGYNNEHNFFCIILSDKEFCNFAEDLLQNSRNNDAIEIIDKKKHLKPDGVKSLKKVSPLKPRLGRANFLRCRFLQLYDQHDFSAKNYLITLFQEPLISNNLIQLSRKLYDDLGFTPSEVEKLCILSLALFVPNNQFNGIDRLRWAIKKGLYHLAEKTINEGFHPNWVVEYNGMTALHTSLSAKEEGIAGLLLRVQGIDFESPNFFNQTPLDIAQSHGFPLIQQRLCCLLEQTNLYSE